MTKYTKMHRWYIVPIFLLLLGISAVSTGATTNYQALAVSAVNDVIGNFWSGSATTGNVYPTWDGIVGDSLPDPRGGIWQSGEFVMLMENLWEVNHDSTLQQRIQAEWNFYKSQFTLNQLTTCGVGCQIQCEDDAGWDAWTYIKCYLVTNDPYALQCAEGLENRAYARWYDSAVGGGMWYDDPHDSKSLYQCCNVLGMLKIYELTGTKSYLTQALLCYTWMEKRLLRSDNLYWCDYSSSGPVGSTRPNDIQEAGSVSYFGGNMMMGIIHARLYKDTGQDIYRVRALRTAAAIRGRYLDTNGVYVDDRDAWTDATFAGEWAREVLSLPGVDSRDIQALKTTASAVYANDRTSTGYYGGCWDGPVGTHGDVWSNIGSTPNQIMTSCMAVSLIVGAANLP
jgi:hypothetical protein